MGTFSSGEQRSGQPGLPKGALRPEQDSAQLLEGQNRVLEHIAKGAPVHETLDFLLRIVEPHCPGMLCSILLLDDDGVHVHHGAAPSLPDSFVRAVDGQSIGPCAGSCGTAAFRREPVIVEDIATDPLWANYRELALKHGLRACWSTPIFDEQRRVLGTFALYFRTTGLPTDRHRELIDMATQTAAIAISGNRRIEALRASEERLRLAVSGADLGIWEWDLASDRLIANDRFKAIFGWTGEASDLTRSRFVDAIETEDRPRIQDAIQRSLAGRAEYDIEYRIVHPDGSLRWIASRGRGQYDATGKPVRMLGVALDITERKQIEHALKKSEREFRAIFGKAPLGIAVIDSTTGRFRKVNQQYCAITGYPENELLTLTFQSITHPDDLQKDLDGMRRLLEGNLRTLRMEKRYIRKDGSVIWVGLTCVPLWEAPGTELQHVAMVEDITDRKLAEDRLAESERKYRILVEHANSIILRWDSEGRIVFINEFGQRFFGYSEDEMLGRHVMGTIVPPTERSGRDLRRLIDQIRTDPKAFEQSVNENMRRNGERVWIAWANRVVRDPQGQRTEILSVGTDITARLQAEEEVRRLNEDLQRHAEELERRVAERTTELAAARDRAEAADRLKSAFLATMSHELRTPLNSIIGFTGIVLKGLAGPLTAEQNKQLDMVRASARHLLNLINDVLDISKIEAGELAVSCEPVDLHASIAKAVGIVKPLAERKGLALQVYVPLDLGQTLSDERRVEQVLLNLLTNAVKFTERGEVTLTVESASDAVHMRVTDTGIGIKPEDLAIIFQPFRQVDSGTTRNHEGTGLGLAICRRLADLMGAEIRAASEWGKGSVFTFTLPLRRPGHP